MKYENLKILVADDEEDFCEFVSDFLKKKLDCRVFVAKNGRDAFELMATQRPDVIVSDIRMPDGDGIEFLGRIRRIKMPKIPIVIFTTGSIEIPIEVLVHEGADAVFHKPFELTDLVNSIERLLTPIDQRWPAKRYNSETGTISHIVGTFDKNKSQSVLIGRGGAFLPTSNITFPRLNEKISFSISVENSKTIRGRGIVRWLRQAPENGLPAGIGMEFEEVNEEGRSLLLNILQQITPTAFIPRQ